jgi:aminoglycoside phosphotransferase (APT) family kinase protein
VLTTPAGLDLDALRTWFAEHVEGASGLPLHATLIAGGRSNLTYVVGDGAAEWVLRRPPLGHVVETAHDMGREYRVIHALADTEVPVPRAFAYCDDPEVNGAPFYVMSKVEGRTLRLVAEYETIPFADRAVVSRNLITVLARLHDVDADTVGLGELGRPEGFLARNLARWGKQWAANQTRELPAMDELGHRLGAALPESPVPTIIHGDYRLDNTLLAPDGPEVAAVLDWEMSTLGDPLTDIGLFLVYWKYYGQGLGETISMDPVGKVAGFATVDEIIGQYATLTGRDVSNVDYYVVFALYKLAAILEGIHKRYLAGQTVGEGFDRMDVMVDDLVTSALDIASRSPLRALRG